mgnify:CR=1 FL=1
MPHDRSIQVVTRTCRTCQDNGPDVAYRPRQRAVLCAGCYLDAIAGSSTARVAVALVERQDRYAQLASRHGIA